MRHTLRAIRFLQKINGEAKDCRLTNFEVVGKVKVTSYEDIKEAGAKRAAKNALKENRTNVDDLLITLGISCSASIWTCTRSGLV
jgi:hypothetical protein